MVGTESSGTGDPLADVTIDEAPEVSAPDATGRTARELARAAWVRHRFLIFVTVIATLPVLAAFSKAVAHGWWPDGDDAILGMKVADVFSSHPPTTGMRSTSGNADPSLSSHHPGPMAIYLLAIPAGLLSFHPTGLLIGTALIHIGLIVGVCIVARRRGGTQLVLLALAAALVVQWAVGPEALFRPLNPYPASIGVLLLLLLTWSLLVGDTACAWGFVIVASLVAQANLAFLPLVAVLTVVVVLAAVFRWSREKDRPPARHAFGIGRGASRSSRIAVAAFVLCWLPALVETVTFKDSNPLQIFRYIVSGVDKDQMGWGPMLKAFVPQLVPLPGGFSAGQDVLLERSGLMTVLGVVVLAALVLVALPWPRSLASWSDPLLRTAARVVLVALAVFGWSFASAPMSVVGVPFYWLLPVWPIVTFAWVVLASAALRVAARLVARRHSPTQSTQPWWRAAPGRRLSAVVLGVLAIVATQSPVVLAWKDGPGRGASAIVDEAFSAHTPPPAPVRVTSGGGWGAWASVVPAVSYHLRAQGYEVYSITNWPLPEDVTHRWATKAPVKATQIFILEKGADGQWIGAVDGAGWRQIGTVKGKPTTGEGEMAIFLRTPTG